jgi:hypothetical protein
LTLLARVAAVLDSARIPYALIGASALAAHGVSRSTVDQDLLAVDPACFDPRLWDELREAGVHTELNKGDWSDPLAGVVRFETPGERPVDLVVGKPGWQRQVLERAVRLEVGDVTVPVISASDLILLKLYAGGPQDAWDIQQLLLGEDREALRSLH